MKAQKTGKRRLKKKDEEGSYNMVRELTVGDREMYFRYTR